MDKKKPRDNFDDKLHAHDYYLNLKTTQIFIFFKLQQLSNQWIRFEYEIYTFPFIPNIISKKEFILLPNIFTPPIKF